VSAPTFGRFNPLQRKIASSFTKAQSTGHWVIPRTAMAARLQIVPTATAMTNEQEPPDPQELQEAQQADPRQPLKFFERRPGRILLYSCMSVFALFVVIAGIFYL